MLDVDGYLCRLGLRRPAGLSVEALMALHSAHVARVAYNTIDIQLGRRTSIDPLEAAARIVETGRCGYCFQLNGAFGALLEALGYSVRRHRGGVRDSPGRPPLQPFANHMALTVHGLPGPEQDWFVDVGMGDAPYAPMPLRAISARQGPHAYALRCSDDLDGWQFVHDPAGAFATMDFEARPATVADFRGAHANLSASPQSPFVQLLLAIRRDEYGVDKLIGLTLHRVDARGDTVTVITDRDQWFATLRDTFGLPLTDTTARERDRLWQRVVESHAAQERKRLLERSAVAPALGEPG